MRFIFLSLILTSNIVLSSSALAQDIPYGSSYDKRIQRVSYNLEDITKVNTRLGFVTTIIFDEDEVIEKAISGFEAGWSITSHQNKLFITPVPVQQESTEAKEGDTDAAEEAITQKFEPTPRDWRTNLFVSTNKRSYSMDLNMLDAGNNTYAHIVRYSYPDKEAKILEKQQLTDSIELGKDPKNWNYFVKANNKSQNIVPDFAYDDGALTYLGFSAGKSFPSVFLLNDGKEQVINYSVEQKGDYKVMVVHQLNNAFVLRYGTQSVGILNKSFGQYFKPYSSTASALVSREAKMLNVKRP